jgi:hypothetical protein
MEDQEENGGKYLDEASENRLQGGWNWLRLVSKGGLWY